MKINETHELRLLDLTANHINESLKNFSQVKIKDLQLDDLEYLVRQQMWITPLIRICIQKINNNWDDIQIGYPKSDMTEWFERIIKELILLPKRTWDIDKLSFEKLTHILNTNKVREIRLDEDIINDFLNYLPKELQWNDETFYFFENHINSHHGEVLKAIKLIQDYVICLINGNQIRYSRNQNNIIITDLTQFENIVLEELSEDNDALRDWMEKEQRIDYY